MNHYRKVFKSNHLSSADIEDFQEQKIDLKFTVTEVKQEMQTDVAGKKIDANIAYFREGIKPMVLNATNCKAIASALKTPFVENWINFKVEIYVQKNVKFAGSLVDGLRLKVIDSDTKKITEDVIVLKIGQCKDIDELGRLYNQHKPYTPAINKVFEAKKQTFIGTIQTQSK